MYLFETRNEAKKDEKFLLELVDRQKQQPIIVNTADDIADQLDEIERKAKMLADKKRRTKVETIQRQPPTLLQAPIIGRALPSPKKANESQPGEPTETPKTAAQSNFERFSPDSFLQYADRKPLQLPYSPQAHSSASYVPNQILQSLPQGIELGNITALNTDQHLFYNFHSRLIGRFAPLWATMVSQYLYRWLQENNFPRSPQSWVTNVEVILDEKGEVLDVQHTRMSGVWAFDEAPVKAFKTVKQIPNPPAELVDDQGYVRLKFQTEVHWRPSPSPQFGVGPRSR